MISLSYIVRLAYYWINQKDGNNHENHINSIQTQRQMLYKNKLILDLKREVLIYEINDPNACGFFPIPKERLQSFHGHYHNFEIHQANGNICGITFDKLEENIFEFDNTFYIESKHFELIHIVSDAIIELDCNTYTMLQIRAKQSGLNILDYIKKMAA